MTRYQQKNSVCRYQDIKKYKKNRFFLLIPIITVTFAEKM